MSTIITRNSANSGSQPSSLIQGELAINVKDGRLFYGSGSGNVVREFTGSGGGGGTVNTGSFVTTSSFNAYTGSNTSQFAGTASFATTASYYGGSVVSASYAETASYSPAYLPLTGGTINGNVTVNGTASIAFLNVSYESASVIYSSGSNQFGDASTDVQTLWGAVDIKSGPVLITGSIIASSFTGSLLGTASYAIQALSASFVTLAQTANTASYVVTAQTASYVLQAVSASFATSALSASFASTASYVQNAQTASYVTLAQTASYVQTAQTASYVLQAVSASYAITASYALNALSASYAPSTPTFPYTGSAIISGSLTVTGSLLVQDIDGKTNIDSQNRQLYVAPPSPPLAAAVLSVDWGSRTLNDINGNPSVSWRNRDLLTPNSAIGLDWTNDTYLNSEVYQRDYKSATTQNSASTNYNNPSTSYLGDIIESNGTTTIIDSTVTEGNLVYLDTNSTWYPVNQAATGATKLLGIAHNLVSLPPNPPFPTNQSGQILLEGHVVIDDTSTAGPFVAGAAYGLPVYIRNNTTTGTMSTTLPTATGSNIIRVLGHCYQKNSGTITQWMMKFRPSNDWVEI